MELKDWIPVPLLQALVHHIIGNLCAMITVWVSACVAEMLFSSKQTILEIVHFTETSAIVLIFGFLVIAIGIDLLKILWASIKGSHEINGILAV